MNPTHRPLSRQVESFLREFGQSSGLPFSDVLGTEQVHEVLASVGCFFRERLYTPLVTLWIFLSQVLDPDHSMRQAVARFLAFRVAQGWKPCSAETKAYGMARQRLPEEVLAKMTCVTGEQLMRQ